MSASDDTSQYLDYLREAYIWKVNAALEQGREDLAEELGEKYLDEVTQEAKQGRQGRLSAAIGTTRPPTSSTAGPGMPARRVKTQA